MPTIDIPDKICLHCGDIKYYLVVLRHNLSIRN